MKPAFCAVLVACVSCARADSITLIASQDNTLYEHPAGLLSNGSGSFLFAGVTQTISIRRALIRFDLSAIPPGSTIDSAQLILAMDRTTTGGIAFNLHRVTAAWGEGASNAGDPGGLGAPAEPGDATWLHRFYDTEFWSTPGGDFAGAPSATATVAFVGTYQWGPTAGMIADVQHWLDNPSQNFGWILKAADESIVSAKRFHSRESALPDARPRLVVHFTPPPLCPGQGSGACGPADWNEDGVVDFNDLLEFLNRFNAQDPCADLNGDGVVDFNDFLEYLNLFNIGC